MIFLFLCHRKLRSMTQKRSARIAMRQKRILPQKRPAAGGEARERASFSCQLPGCYKILK